MEERTGAERRPLFPVSDLRKVFTLTSVVSCVWRFGRRWLRNFVLVYAKKGLRESFVCRVTLEIPRQIQHPFNLDPALAGTNSPINGTFPIPHNLPMSSGGNRGRKRPLQPQGVDDDQYGDDSDMFDAANLPNDTMATVLALQKEFYSAAGKNSASGGRSGGERTGVVLQHQM